jgi:hypothetical protein
MKQATFIHQAKYTNDLMKKFNMAELKPVSTLMSTVTVLDPNENGDVVDQWECRGMIGSPLYLTATQSAIKFTVSVCVLSCFPTLFTLNNRSVKVQVSQIDTRICDFGFGIQLLHLILLAFPMLILLVVGLTEKIHAMFLDLLLFVGLLANSLLSHNPPQSQSM